MSIIEEALKKAKHEKIEEVNAPVKERSVVEDPGITARVHNERSAHPRGRILAIAAMCIMAIALSSLLLPARYASKRHSAQSYALKVSPTTAVSKSVSGLSVEGVKNISSMLKPKPRFQDFALNGIMQLVDGPRAVVNNVIVGVGDVIDGVIVQKITKNSVVLKNKDEEISLVLR